MHKLPLPLVSITIPCHNKADTILRAIESIKVQTLNNLECFVINDSSSDDSESIILKVIEGDARFHYKKVEFGNVADVRNLGASLSQGLFLCFLDGDDWIGRRFLETCTSEFDSDPSLGIVYSALKTYLPNGNTSISQWPSDFNFDKQLKRKNQCPTCSVIKKECWDRLGGQRRRYCPAGAGAEDGEFHLRAGAYGYNAKMAEPVKNVLTMHRAVTDTFKKEATPQQVIKRGVSPQSYELFNDSLFHYSFMSGQVTGDPNYQELDWTTWHPWTKDDKHPFASVATPKRESHEIRQYDEPIVSVIIPVGPGHEKQVINALDSLEAQTVRKWEAIVVWDSDIQVTRELQCAYPYVRFIDTGSYYREWTQKENGSKDKLILERRTGGGQFGAGYARNIGAKIARAPFLVFLDADDWLYPDALEKMIVAWNEHKAIIYTDYVGKATVEDLTALAPELQRRVYHHNEKTHAAVIGYKSADFDCERAQAQPEGDRPWIWCNVTSLIPKAWHDEIAGFDELMPSWEDVDYHYRMSKNGKCYHRVPEELMVYQFSTGGRRERGRQTHKDLIQYLRDKYEGRQIVPCRGCGGSRRTASRPTVRTTQSNQKMSYDFEPIFIEFVPGQIGNRRVIGGAEFRAPPAGVKSIRLGQGFKIDYGYRTQGDKFYAHPEDVKLMPSFQLIREDIVVLPGRIDNAPQPPQPMASPVSEPIAAPVPEAIEETNIEWPESDEEETVSVDDIITKPLDLQGLPGISDSLAEQLAQDGIREASEILELGADGLERYKGIGPARAEMILAALKEQYRKKVDE